MIRAFKYRIYPTQEQTILIEKHFGCVRFVYNWALANRIELYNQTKQKEHKFAIMTKLTVLRRETEWLQEVNCMSLHESIENMDTAYRNFFRAKKGFPKFHSKHGRQSFTIRRDGIRIKEGKINISKIRGVKIKLSRLFVGEIKRCTVSRVSGKYYVSLLVETEDTEKLKENNSIVGIDLGIKDFATLSNGEKIPNSKFLKKSLKHLKKIQKKFSRATKGSNNRNKARLRLARIHEKISNQRSDFLHKLSTRLIRENQAICIEDLNVSGMKKNHKLAQAISDCGWRQFRTMLDYKAEWYGRKVYVCGRFEPSSKTCTCGHINNDLKLSMREWTCPECGTRHDRDILAANNIKTFALTKVGMTGCNASGDEPIGSSVKEETVK